MIKDQFIYFSKFPSEEGVKSMATNFSSDSAEYNDLMIALEELPEKSLVPEISNYVYGQSFEDLKARLEKLIGSFLFVDYGELGILGDGRNSFQYSQRIAVTVAFKMPNRADQIDNLLKSDHALKLLSKIHAHLLADADSGEVEWLSRGNLDKAEIIPFVATELKSVGWTLMMTCIAPDTLGTHDLYRSFVKNKL